MLNQVGSVVETGEIGIGGPVDAAVIAREQDAGRTRHEGERVLIHVHAMVPPL